MPLHVSHNKRVITTDYNYSEKYWSELSIIIESEIDQNEIKDADEVDRLLKTGFQYLCKSFEEVIQQNLNSSFYVFINCLHEDSLELYELQLKRIPLGIDENAFALSRRILKIIIEQGCQHNLKGCPNFFKEIKGNLKKYISTTEELLYIGEWAYSFSESIAKNKLFPGSTGLRIEDGELVINTYQPYPELFKFIGKDIPKHDSQVAVSKSLIEFKDLLKNEFAVEYDTLFGFTQEQVKTPQYRFGLVFIDNLIELLHEEFEYDKGFLEIFYEGLTLSKDNALSVEDCIIRNQDTRRFIYRPIVRFLIEDKYYYMIPYYKWAESMMTLSTNAFPFGAFPDEWKQFRPIKDFVQKLDNTHDQILEEPITDLLNQHGIFYDTGVKSFKTITGTNINIANTVGDLDILFLDVKNKLIYVCELKHNKSRFDYNNWRRDYSNFKAKYESQLERKTKWAEKNKNVIQEHFEQLYGGNFTEQLQGYDVRGIFIINAPTIYMYNGKYRAFTIKDISFLLKGEYVDVQFEFTRESTGEKYFVTHPYFENTYRVFNEN